MGLLLESKLGPVRNLDETPSLSPKAICVHYIMSPLPSSLQSGLATWKYCRRLGRKRERRGHLLLTPSVQGHVVAVSAFP